MSRTPRLSIDDATRQAVAAASNPHGSAWVSANAGSGKTFVLSRRVVRLLLAGNDPGRILCLTFTKAAAAEMAKRVFDTLAEWTTLPDEKLAEAIAAARDWAVTVSLFCDPDPAAPEHAARIGAERIEIYTGPYGACYDDPARAAKELDKIAATAEAARAAGLGVNAGHDLTVDNIPALIKRAPFIREMSIGHGFTADALIYGFAESVRRFRRAMGEV